MKCGRVSFMPVLARFGRFGGLSRKSGPTDHPAAKSTVKQKFVKNNGIGRAMVVRDFRTTKDDYLMAGNKILKNYENIFGN